MAFSRNSEEARVAGEVGDKGDIKTRPQRRQGAPQAIRKDLGFNLELAEGS